MGGVNGPNNRVHIWQTSHQVVVQRYGLTSDRKVTPRPPTPAHLRQNQYMCTLKINACGIHLQERNTTCDTQDTGSFEQHHAFFETMVTRATPENHTWSQKSQKNFDGPRSPLPEGECASFNTRLNGNHDDQATHLLSVSVHDHTHRSVWGVKSKGLGAPRTNGCGCRTGDRKDRARLEPCINRVMLGHFHFFSVVTLCHFTPKINKMKGFVFITRDRVNPVSKGIHK